MVKDLTNQRFGRLAIVALGPPNQHGQTMWLCQCDCGIRKLIRSSTLINGRSRSCGCQSKISGRNKRTHGMTDTPTYSSWCHMKERCDNQTCAKYPKYGGRGITYDPRWSSFENFLADMGERPKGRYSIDRIDNDGNYTKDNCRWATDSEQANNNRHPRKITYLGITRSVTEWAQAIGISRLTLSDRLRRGWLIEKALTKIPRGSTSALTP